MWLDLTDQGGGGVAQKKHRWPVQNSDALNLKRQVESR
jgi:hypothetical protein